jgi:hypothetical protein
MCLTEPQCGTDLGLIRTRAVPAGDGSYRVTGNKIFISAGEHDLSDNIVHLVLAKLPDAPKGTRGISLFLVPKFIPKADGTPDLDRAAKFNTLIDALYEAGTKLVALAADEPETLYPQGDGRFEFDRTVSRLMEMQSEDYLAEGHGPR